MAGRARRAARGGEGAHPPERRAPRPEHVRARGRDRLPHLLVLRPRHRCPERDLAAARPHVQGARRRPRGVAASTRRIRVMERSAVNLPPIVSEKEWQAAWEALLAEEKDATRARDTLAARRRRLPMVRIEKDYV